MTEPQDAQIDSSYVRHAAAKPYSPRNPVPTIGRYKDRKEEQKSLGDRTANSEGEDRTSREGDDDNQGAPLGVANEKNVAESGVPESRNRNADPEDFNNEDFRGQDPGDGEDDQKVTTQNHNSKTSLDMSKITAIKHIPYAKKKKPEKPENGERKITDPITHLTTVVHDFTQNELDAVPESLKSLDSTESSDDKSEGQLRLEEEEIIAGDKSSLCLFPPPSLKLLQSEIGSKYTLALVFSLFAVWAIPLVTVGGAILITRLVTNSKLSLTLVVMLLSGSVLSALAICWVTSLWLRKRFDEIWETHTWEASAELESVARKSAPESTMWLNSLLSEVWPLVNPDLFNSVADNLEDVMQSSLPPKFVRMVAVTDLGQGMIAPRILGARWLPTGAANQSVSIDGTAKSRGRNGENDRKTPGDAQVEEGLDDKGRSQENTKQEQEEDESTREGLEAENGDFVNLELSISYRASKNSKSFGKKSKTAHLHLVFYLIGSIPFPVFVSLRGFVCRVRMRLQLCPDPPFVNLLTMSLMGQPRADISCVPINRKLVSVMDLPIISSFVQSSLDAALSEYVGPRSLTLNLKQMLEGDDFKKNTNARGTIMVNIKACYGFKESDVTIPGMGHGSSDAYVSIGWAKFGKALWSTRVILKDMKPVWDETTFILVSMEEVNANESLRIQLWDSDRLSADDDLGRIEIPLKDLMQNMNGSLTSRTDGFLAMEAGEKMPGKLDWAVGYFEKVQITQDQLAAQQLKPRLRDMQQLKNQVSKDASKKLREAGRQSSEEEAQQKAQGFEEEEKNLISASPPPQGFPSGILAVQIHNITGLSLASLHKDRNNQGDEFEDDSQENDDLPSSYATLIINNKTVYRTRTKPKNSKPFFNAATERFIRDWQSTEVIVSVRDRRSHELDPLLGFVYLPLEEVLKKRCQLNETFPLSGGAGYGRIRISLMFRSVELKLPKNMRGWDYGTLEITGPITSTGLSNNLNKQRITLLNSLGKGKIYSSEEGKWIAKKDRTIRLAVSARYSSNIIFQFRDHQSVKNRTVAFAVLWLKDISDDEEQKVDLTVWSGDSDLKRAKANCLKEVGENLGTLMVPLRFYSGLSEHHKSLAKKNTDIAHIMELIDAMHDQQEKKVDLPDEDMSSAESISSDDSDSEEDLQDDGKRNLVSDLKEYKHHRKTLERKNRGLMQWRVARTGYWLKSKMGDSIETVKQHSLSHHKREPKIETEA